MEVLLRSAVAIIPARYGSTRLHAKPLALIAGKPMIEWVASRVLQTTGFSNVVVATDHPDIMAIARQVGADAVMTREDHTSGTDRVWEAAQQYPDAELIFNVQGDEPLVNPLYLEEAIAHLSSHHETTDMVTLMSPVTSNDELDNSNVVKVVTAANKRALYFSRSAIPYVRNTASGQDATVYRHMGIYGFTRKALARFVSLPPSRLEQLEQLEQLRALEDGMTIDCLNVPQCGLSVDVPSDIQAVEAAMAAQQGVLNANR